MNRQPTPWNVNPVTFDPEVGIDCTRADRLGYFRTLPVVADPVEQRRVIRRDLMLTLLRHNPRFASDEMDDLVGPEEREAAHMRSAARILGHFGDRTLEILGVLGGTALDSGCHDEARIEAARALHLLEPEAGRIVLLALTSDPMEGAAARALGVLATLDPATAIWRALGICRSRKRESHPFVSVAIHVLCELRPARAAALAKGMLSSRDAALRLDAQGVIDACSNLPVSHEPADPPLPREQRADLSTLLASVRGRDAPKRLAALRRLEQSSPTLAAGAGLVAGRSDIPRVRMLAQEMLVRLGLHVGAPGPE